MMDSKTKRVFRIVFITLFVDLLAFTLILPLLPKILAYYSLNDKSGSYKLFNDNLKALQNIISVPESHNQVLLAGILGSWFSLLQFISSPFFGALSDKYGRKPILILTMSGTICSYLVWFCSSNSFPMFILSRTIGGLCKANVGLSLAIVSDVANENTRGRGMAIVGSSFSLAFIFGPLFGAWLSSLAKTPEGALESQLIVNPSLIATILAVLDLILVIGFLEETNERVEKGKSSKKNSFPASPIHFINPKSLFSFKLVEEKSKTEKLVLRKSALIYFYYLLFYSGLEFTMSFLTHIRFNFSSMDQGKLYLFSGILMTTIQGGYIRRMKGGKEAMMAYLGLMIIVPSFALIGISKNVSQVYVSLGLYSFASAVVVPCLTTIVSAQSREDNRGVVMGTFRSIGALARAIGPFVASIMFWTLGPTWCYLLGSVALYLPLHLMGKLKMELNRNEELGRKAKRFEYEKVSSKMAKAN